MGQYLLKFLEVERIMSQFPGGLSSACAGETVQTFNVYDMLIPLKINGLLFFFLSLVGGLALFAHGSRNQQFVSNYGLAKSALESGNGSSRCALCGVVFIGFASIPIATQIGELNYSWERNTGAPTEVHSERQTQELGAMPVHLMLNKEVRVVTDPA